MDASGHVLIMASDTTIMQGSGTQITLGGGPILYRPELVKGGSQANRPNACAAWRMRARPS